MADIELVIKIPEDTVNKIKDNIMFEAIPSEILWDVTSAIINSIPLPKNHGRLIDENNLWFEDIDDVSCVTQRNVENAPTIIEADKAEREDKE